jgi:hypothetical protein
LSPRSGCLCGVRLFALVFLSLNDLVIPRTTFQGVLTDPSDPTRFLLTDPDLFGLRILTFGPPLKYPVGHRTPDSLVVLREVLVGQIQIWVIVHIHALTTLVVTGWFDLRGGTDQALRLVRFPFHMIFGANAIHP